jgi:hypothetical protein
VSVAAWIVVVAAVVATIAFVVWMLTTRHDPERAASHEPGRLRTGEPTERPADAGAESMRTEYRNQGPMP